MAGAGARSRAGAQRRPLTMRATSRRTGEAPTDPAMPMPTHCAEQRASMAASSSHARSEAKHGARRGIGPEGTAHELAFALLVGLVLAHAELKALKRQATQRRRNPRSGPRSGGVEGRGLA